MRILGTIAAIMVVILSIFGIYYLNIDSKPKKSQTKETQAPSKKPVKPSPSSKRTPQPSKPVQPSKIPKPQEPQGQTDWQRERALQEQHLKDLVSHMKSLDPESEELIQIESQIYQQMQEMGLSEYHQDGWGTNLYLPDVESLLYSVRHLDPAQKDALWIEIATLKEMKILRDSIMKEREENKRLNRADPPELLEKFYNLQAREFRIEKEMGNLYEALYPSYQPEEGEEYFEEPDFQ